MSLQPSAKELAERMRQTLELVDAGFHMQRTRLRRENPDATDHEVEVMFIEWLNSFPMMSGVDLRVVTGPEPGGRFPPEYWVGHGKKSKATDEK